MNIDDVKTILCDMPTTIKAYTISDKDGFYTIVLNARLSREQNLISYKHEIGHIINGDFQSKNSAGLIEFYAHHNN